MKEVEEKGKENKRKDISDDNCMYVHKGLV